MADGEKVPSELDDGWRLYKAGKWDQAVACFRQALAADPDSLAAHLMLGRALASRGDSAAGEHLGRAAELAPDQAEPLCALAGWLAQARRFDEAVAAFEAALALDPACLPALLGLAGVRIRQKRHSAGYQLYDRALVLAPGDAEACRLYAKALNDHAVRLADRAQELKGAEAEEHLRFSRELNAKALDLAARAVELRPGWPKSERVRAAALALAARFDEAGPDAPAPAAASRRPAIWPRKAAQFRDLERLVREAVLPGCEPPAPILDRRSRVVTLGSCFAEYVADALRELGVDTYFQKRGESIDNLYATRILLEWAAGALSGEDGAYAAALGREGSPLFRARFEAADVVILSLGVSAAWFERATGRFVLAGGDHQDKAELARRCDFRMISLEENVANLRRVIALVRGFNPAARIVLTVSPVPLAATLERRSAVQADAVSKSTLRLAAETVMRDGPEGVFYWPSFEIVRWVGGHLQGDHPPVFGADDGASRHVSMWLVRLIIRLFLEVFGEGLAPAAA